MNLKFPKYFLELKDHFLTQEKFDLYIDPETELIKTIPQPENLDPYYESEDYLSHDDNQDSFFARCYNFAKGFNLKSKTSLIRKFAQNGSVLDIGAGVGDLVLALKEAQLSATGFEPSEKARTVARNKGVDLYASLNEVEANSFQLISMYHVLEHVPDVEKQKENILQLLKPNGVLILALPNYESFDAKYYNSYWAGYDVPRHLFHFNKKAVKSIFDKEFEIIKMQPMWFDSLYVSILSSKYKKSAFPFLSGIFIGLFSNLKAIFTNEPSSITYVLKKRF
ncbi:methyltransferase family protein [Nonlabens dokdonensis]|jgi:2-polyprenyl-3-methyl-5-hydroxy-6-metoxy-1,4-benzoquinol methylase|uniref:SAM dependent methyltransferase n=2 Tax=Nonlabens dokdonensis TaxID=328515 RepID=L7W8K4_NONDD|nr:class I SAM-dependent methyltransferase [Nonlabens dokdonensis]AGC76552.1 SAM dependent methyltransferase [Nonlabens dokdonensis DSW-6]PZX44203.1 methyltransferase family protein [Nonlabens dokdonensis]